MHIRISKKSERLRKPAVAQRLLKKVVKEGP